MISSITMPALAGFQDSFGQTDRGRTPRLVIHQAAQLATVAIEAVVHKYTCWHVACTTTDLRAAAMATRVCQAKALLFDDDGFSEREISLQIRRLKLAAPDAALILLTVRSSAIFLQSAIDAGINACMHAREGVADFVAMFGAVARGDVHWSPRIEGLLGSRARPEFGIRWTGTAPMLLQIG